MVTVEVWHTTGVDAHSHLFECYSSRRTKSENRRPGYGGKPLCGECSHWADSRTKCMHGDVRSALERYKQVVNSTDLAATTKWTYLRHAETFVRWLEGGFTPGERVDTS